jgi:DNA-binding transcriptional regulator YdaS (Cro superfamily)
LRNSAIDSAVLIAGSQGQLAARIGRCRGLVNQWAVGAKQPDRCSAMAIQAAVQGRVTAEELLGAPVAPSADAA